MDQVRCLAVGHDDRLTKDLILIYVPSCLTASASLSSMGPILLNCCGRVEARRNRGRLARDWKADRRILSLVRQMLKRRPLGRGSDGSESVTSHNRSALLRLTSMNSSPVHFHFLGILGENQKMRSIRRNMLTVEALRV